MRVAIIGAAGQLGTSLVAGLGPEAIPFGRSDIDITNPGTIWEALDHQRPDAVINCAAYNFVDKAELETDAAMLSNRRGPGFLADYCRERDLKLVQVSTDYVFDGRNGRKPWTEEDEPAPISSYACSKYSGEQLVRTHCPRHFVVRTCGLYGRAATAGKGNFVESILRFAKERPELKVVSDQQCTPTSTAYLASALIALIKTDAYGLYHATNSGSCSWYEFAAEIVRLANLDAKVTPITTHDYGARARRPQYSVLDCSKLTSVIGWSLPPWRDALGRYLDERESPRR